MRPAVVLLSALALALGSAVAAPSQPRAVRTERDSPVQVRLTEVLRIGSEDGPDALGRVMGAAFGRGGRIFVTDDRNHRVSVFGPDGRLVRHLGRKGAGPGEFQAPWLVEVDPRDTLFVWDQAGARMSVFGPDLAFRRSFALPPHWLVTGLEFLADGRLLVAAYGRGERGGLHVIDREGRLGRSFGPAFPQTGFGGYEASVLGGNVALDGGTIAYAKKSPYEVSFYGLDGRARGSCQGPRGWTTPPADVVERSSRGDALHWNRFVHSASLMALGDELYLNVVRDPVRGRTVLDLLRRDCVLLRRTELEVAVSFMDRAGDRLLAARTLDYPEVVVYRMEVVSRGRSRSSSTHPSQRGRQ